MKVNGEGKLESKIWIIGEAPGANEELKRKPFVGGAGMVLDSMLEQVGIDRGDCYIDNIIQERPPKNNFAVYYRGSTPTAELIAAHVRLKELIEKWKPNVVIALGNEPLFALTRERGITKWRGSILNCRGTKVVPTIHPAMIMRQYEFRPQAIFDLTRAREQSKFPEVPHPYTNNFIINPSFDTIMRTLVELNTRKYVSFDIETDLGYEVEHKFASAHPITCIGFGWSKQDAICIPLYYAGVDMWTEKEEQFIITKIRELFANPEVNFIAQNAQFDMTNLKYFFEIEIANLFLDTMIAQHCVYPELPKSLAFLTSIYTQRPYHKDLGKVAGSQNSWTYNCLDCVTTWESAFGIMKEAIEFGTWDFYLQHSHKLIKPLMSMQLKGVLINVEERDKLEKNLTKDLISLEDTLNKAVGRPLNPSSPKQMREFLYDELNLPPIYKAGMKGGMKAKVLSSNEEALEELNAKFPNPIFELVIDIRKIRKILSTYVQAKLGTDSRIRCAYAIDGTDTGRLASRKSIFNTGTNLQNIPRGPLVRSLFIPDPGMKFAEADLSQAEARVVAYLSEDPKLLELFELGSDVHTRQAGYLFHKHPDQVTPEERQKAKRVVHASNYKISKRKLSKELGCSELEAQGFINQYFLLYPKLKIWHLDADMTLKKLRILSTPYGRRRMFFGRLNDDLLRAAIAFVPQSTVSDLINVGLVKAWNNLPDEWEILMQVHDSVLMQIPEGVPDIIVKKYCEHYFINSIQIKRRELRIPIEIKVGKDWGHMEKINEGQA